MIDESSILFSPILFSSPVVPLFLHHCISNTLHSQHLTARYSTELMSENLLQLTSFYAFLWLIFYRHRTLIPGTSTRTKQSSMPSSPELSRMLRLFSPSRLDNRSSSIPACPIAGQSRIAQSPLWLFFLPFILSVICIPPARRWSR